MEVGTLWFTEITPLDDEEVAWLNLYAKRDVAYEPLPTHTESEAYSLFQLMWRWNTGLCKTCKAPEGKCDNTTCIRVRITNKWFLSNGGIVPEVQWTPEGLSV